MNGSLWPGALRNGSKVRLLPKPSSCDHPVSPWVDVLLIFLSFPTQGHYSEVVISITESESDTNLSLRQTGVPFADIERTKEGWHIHQFERMKMILGFGAGLNLSF